MTDYNYGSVVYVTTIDEYGTVIEEAMPSNNFLVNVLLGDGTTVRAYEEEIEHEDLKNARCIDYDVEEDEEEEAPKGKIDKISQILQHGT